MRDTKAVTEARDALSKALIEQERARSERYDKRIDKLIGRCFISPHAYNTNFVVLRRIVEPKTKWKGYLTVETVNISNKQLSFSTGSYSLTSLEQECKKEISQAEFTRIRNKCEDAILDLYKLIK